VESRRGVALQRAVATSEAPDGIATAWPSGRRCPGDAL
jgi:hypothetical protein